MYSILLVDDEPLALKGNKIIIERSGLDTLHLYEAEDGLEALMVLKEHSVDLVITDIKMPNMDGVKLCETIYESGMPTKAIIVSGFADFQYARAALKYGVKDYILKPVGREELIQSVSSVLYESGSMEKGRLSYIPHKELENMLVLLQQGLWLGENRDVEKGLNLYKSVMQDVDEAYCRTVSEDFCRLLAEKLSLKTGYIIQEEVVFGAAAGKAEIMKKAESYIQAVKQELLYRRSQTDYNNVLLDMAKKYLEDNYDKEITLADLAARTGFSTNYFCQIFKEKTGKTYVQFRTELRIHKAKELLGWSDKSVTDIAMEVGYNDSTYFIRVFKEYTGQTPNSYKKNREAGIG